MITLCMYWYDVNVFLYEKNSKSGPCGYLYMDKQLKVFHLYLLTLILCVWYHYPQIWQRTPWYFYCYYLIFAIVPISLISCMYFFFKMSHDQKLLLTDKSTFYDLTLSLRFADSNLLCCRPSLTVIVIEVCRENWLSPYSNLPVLKQQKHFRKNDRKHFRNLRFIQKYTNGL